MHAPVSQEFLNIVARMKQRGIRENSNSIPDYGLSACIRATWLFNR
jgi:hypothetical protein